MASIPTFDYLAISPYRNSYQVRYIVSNDGIDYGSQQVDQLESFGKMMNTINSYFVSIFGEKPSQVSLILLYSNSITLRFKTYDGLMNVKLPLRINSNQLIKSPFSTISGEFEGNVMGFTTDLDRLVRG